MIKRMLLVLAIAVGCMLVSPAPAQAKDLFANPKNGVCQRDGTATDSAVCTDNTNTTATQDPFSGKDGLAIKLTNIIAFIGGAAAVIMLIVSSLRFITSGSDISTGARTDTDVEDARRSIANTIIGLIVIVLARQIILFVLNKLSS